MNPTSSTTDLTPILDPLLALLRSRKFLLAVITALVDTLIIAVPSLVPVRDQLLAVITALALALIGTTAAEDMGKVHEAAKVEAARHLALANKGTGTGDTDDTEPVTVPPYRGNSLH